MWEIIWDVFVDALLDSVKMLPFLFGAYLLIEYIEHRASHDSEDIGRQRQVRPPGGALLGCVPQCRILGHGGQSVRGTHHHSGHVDRRLSLHV